MPSCLQLVLMVVSLRTPNGQVTRLVRLHTRAKDGVFDQW